MRDKQWEYKVEWFSPGIFSYGKKSAEVMQDKLSRLGLEGWELCGNPVLNDVSNSSMLVFKRPR